MHHEYEIQSLSHYITAFVLNLCTVLLFVISVILAVL